MNQAARITPKTKENPAQSMEAINIADDILLDMLFDFHTKAVLSEVQKAKKTK